MPVIQFRKNYPPVEVTEGETLMQALLQNGMPVASSCHGDGVCAKCRIQIVKGGENLSAANATELQLREKNKIEAGTRISCQTRVLGDVEVDTTYW